MSLQHIYHIEVELFFIELVISCVFEVNDCWIHHILLPCWKDEMFSKVVGYDFKLVTCIWLKFFTHFQQALRANPAIIYPMTRQALRRLCQYVHIYKHVCRASSM